MCSTSHPICLFILLSGVFCQVFAQLLPSLVKITLFSSAVHQIAFTWNSGLNFAVGQVQDAGLIFLSSMAGHVADFMLQSGHNSKAIVSTALFVLSIYTALMGLVLIVIGRLRLASVIQYLPMPGMCYVVHDSVSVHSF